MDGLLCKQGGNGSEASKARDQKARLGSNEIVQEPNKERTTKEREEFKHRRCEIHSDCSDAEVREKKE